MKVIINSEKSFILFFNKFIEELDLDDNYEDKFKNILLKLKKYYGINIYGFYNVYVYNNKYYGTILKIEKENDFDLMYKQIDMHIVIEKDSKVLYKVSDILFIKNKEKYNIYFYNNMFYLEIIDDLLEKEMLELLENSIVIFENTDIINKAKLIKYSLFTKK